MLNLGATAGGECGGKGCEIGSPHGYNWQAHGKYVTALRAQNVQARGHTVTARSSLV